MSGYNNGNRAGMHFGGAGDRGTTNPCTNGCNCGGNANGGGLRPGTTQIDAGAGGGGATSSKGLVANTFATVDGTCDSAHSYTGYAAVNTGDAHYSSSGSGQCGQSEDQPGTRGRVVLLVGGQATFFDSPGSTASFVV